MKKLLLIVDDWERLERFEHALADTFEVHSAGFGPEGLGMAREIIPDAIYVDLGFENMTEDEALYAIRSETTLSGARVLTRSDVIGDIVAVMAAIRRLA